MVINEILMIVKWKTVPGTNEPDITVPANCSWEDVTGQQPDILPCTPNSYIIRAFVTNPVLTNIQGSPNYIILARRTYDDAVEPRTYTFDNFGEMPTAAQLTTLKNLITTRFPGVDEDKLTDAGVQILRNDLTREQSTELLARRWRRFVKA